MAKGTTAPDVESARPHGWAQPCETARPRGCEGETRRGRAAVRERHGAAAEPLGHEMVRVRARAQLRGSEGAGQCGDSRCARGHTCEGARGRECETTPREGKGVKAHKDEDEDTRRRSRYTTL